MRVRPWNDPWKLAGNEDISVLGSRTQYELCQPEICPPDIMTHRQNDIDHGCSAMAWWSSSSRYSCWCSLTHATHPNIVLDKGSPPSLPPSVPSALHACNSAGTPQSSIWFLSGPFFEARWTPKALFSVYGWQRALSCCGTSVIIVFRRCVSVCVRVCVCERALSAVRF